MDTEKEIENKIFEIDKLVEENKRNIYPVKSSILNLYNSIKELIDNFDYNVNYDKKLHEKLKFRYHSHKAIYFEIIGKVSNAKREFLIADRYSIKDSPSEVKNVPDPNGILILDNVLETKEENEIIREEFNKLQTYFDSNQEILPLIEKLEKEFEIVKKIPKTMSEYLASKYFQENLFPDTVDAVIRSGSFKNNPNPENEWIESFQKLKNSYESRYNKRKIGFMKNIVRLGYGEQSKTLVYSEIPETIEENEKRKRLINSEFHPDNNLSLNDDYKTVKDCFIILEKICTDMDEEISIKCAAGGKSMTNESHGDNFLNISEKYSNLINTRKGSELNNLNLVDSNQTINLTTKELDYYRIHNALEAYKYYNKADLEMSKDNKNCIEMESALKHKMAKSLTSANCYLEANLCILSLFCKSYRNLQITTGEQLNEAKKEDITLEQDQAKSNRCSTELFSFEGFNMIFILDKSFDHSKITAYIKSIETKTNTTRFCLIKPDAKLIDFANMSKNSSCAKSVSSAIQHYHEGNFQMFFEILQSLNKDSKRNKNLNIKKPINVDPIQLIKLLLKRNFYPHVIAYLLILIGLAFISGQIGIPPKNSKDLETVAVTFFIATESNDLNQKANQLDYPEEFSEIPTLLHFDDFPSENSSSKTISNADELSLPYVARLNEMQIIAKLNLVLIRYIQKDLEAAKTNLRQIRSFVESNYCFVTPQKIRLERIEDFLSIIDPTFIPQQYSNETKAEMSESDFDRHLSSLEKELKKITEKSERVKICKEIASISVEKAETKEKENKLDSLICWSHAKLEYSRLCKDLNNKDEDAIMNYVKCLIKLNEYKEAKILLDKHGSSLLENSNYWYFLALINKKKHLYDEAFLNLKKSLEKDCNNANADKEFRFMNYLIKTVPLEDKLKVKIDLQYEENYYTSRINSTEPYRILSMDGGGIRGINPAFWLYEIERKTNRPISHLFNMLSGTSTGAIIAAGLSVPKPNNNFTPRYTALDLLDIYRTSGKKIFSKDSLRRIPGLDFVVSKYTDAGRRGIFEQYFQENTLDSSLTDIVIPATYGSVLNKPHLFTTFEAKKRKSNEFLNTKYVDALMATTAAPTYFSHYEIEGRVFIDGGVQANNPSQVAYKTAIENGIDEKTIHLYSFGTGDCILSDVLHKKSFNGKVKWAIDLKDVTISSQSGITDDFMSTTLRGRYTRWQIWMENEIKLNDYSEETLNKMQEMANEYIEELCFSDTNSFNKLLEDLEK